MEWSAEAHSGLAKGQPMRQHHWMASLCTPCAASPECKGSAETPFIDIPLSLSKLKVYVYPKLAIVDTRS
eukprot:5702488-Amphidinium_carterae.1